MFSQLFINLHLIERAQFRAALRSHLAVTGLRGGAYGLIWRRGTTPVLIPRLVGADATGLLYAGQSADLERRVLQALDSLREGGAARHALGVRFARYPRLRELIPLSELAFELWLHSSPRQQERELLEAYTGEHGEGPPLNALTL